MPAVQIVDQEGAVLAYLNGYPGLTGPGNPVPNGFHLGKPRSPASGAIGGLQVSGPRTLDDISDTARVQILVKAVGSEGGARSAAEFGCRKAAEAIRALTGAAVVVTTRRGELVKFLVAGDSQGPTFTGDIGGEATYQFDAALMCQPA
jgi:hypothetical protein